MVLTGLAVFYQAFTGRDVDTKRLLVDGSSLASCGYTRFLVLSFLYYVQERFKSIVLILAFRF